MFKNYRFTTYEPVTAETRADMRKSELEIDDVIDKIEEFIENGNAAKVTYRN